MRHTTKDSGLIRNAQGQVIGINMGWDFVSEHEWGTSTINGLLGIQGSGYGPDRYLATNFSNFYFSEVEIDGVTWYTVAVSQNRHGLENPDYSNYLPQWFRDDQEVIAAWSGHQGFVFAVRDRSLYVVLQKQIQSGNVIVTGESIFASESNPFSNGGLKLLFYTEIPEDWVNDWTEAHLSLARLDDAVESTGIRQRLKEAGLGYYALRPAWTDDQESGVRFFLNPQDQKNNNYGWFTVTDLDAWIKGKGPIPKNEDCSHI